MYKLTYMMNISKDEKVALIIANYSLTLFKCKSYELNKISSAVIIGRIYI